MSTKQLSPHGGVEPLRFLSEQEVRDIASQFGTPTFVYDLKTIEDRYGYFSTLPNAFGLTVRYSVKANPNGAILQSYDRLGAWFDVSSVWEARRVAAAGVKVQKILLTAQELSDGWKELCAEGMEFDAGSLKQIDDFGKAFPGHKVTIRVNPGFGSGLVKKLTSGGPHSSFGIWHEYLEEALGIAKQHGLQIGRLHFHIGSGHESSVLERGVSQALDLCDRFPDVQVLNFGGGYRIAAFSNDPVYDHRGMATRIAEQITGYAKRSGRKLRLELEPGTYLMSLAGSLVARVIDVVSTGVAGHNHVKIDAGVTEVLRPSYYGSVHPLISVAQAKRDRSARPYMVSGHCCIAGDSLTTVPGNSEDFRPIPLLETQIGDLLVVERAGGYAASMCMKNFNSYPEAAEIVRIAEGRYELVRRRQTLSQLVQNEVDVPGSALRVLPSVQRASKDAVEILAST
jgi:diaminopimelate decarboxylase